MFTFEKPGAIRGRKPQEQKKQKTNCWRNSASKAASMEAEGESMFQVESLHFDHPLSSPDAA